MELGGAVNADDEVHFDVGGLAGSGDEGDGAGQGLAVGFSKARVEVHQVGNDLIGPEDRDVDIRHERGEALSLRVSGEGDRAGFGDGEVDGSDGDGGPEQAFVVEIGGEKDAADGFEHRDDASSEARVDFFRMAEGDAGVGGDDPAEGLGQFRGVVEDVNGGGGGFGPLGKGRHEAVAIGIGWDEPAIELRRLRLDFGGDRSGAQGIAYAGKDSTGHRRSPDD